MITRIYHCFQCHLNIGFKIVIYIILKGVHASVFSPSSFPDHLLPKGEGVLLPMQFMEWRPPLQTLDFTHARKFTHFLYALQKSNIWLGICFWSVWMIRGRKVGEEPGKFIFTNKEKETLMLEREIYSLLKGPIESGEKIPTEITTPVENVKSTIEF